MSSAASAASADGDLGDAGEVHAAVAVPSDDDAGTSLGLRVGGYGFRRDGDERPVTGWEECRMNGLGVFAQRGVGGPLFAEAGLDAYARQDFLLSSPSTDVPIDRMSGLLSAAIGARTQLAPWLGAYVQFGAGVELTRLSLPYGSGADATTIRGDKVLPEGFFGAGADIRVARGTYIGASLRLLVMGNFDYSASKAEMGAPWIGTPTASEVFAASPDLAMQGQFYLRRAL